MKYLAVILGIVIFSVSTLSFASEKDITFLQQGVGQIGIAGAPGPVCVFGDKAFAVVVGKQKDMQVPLVAASEFGKGRIVAFGHNGYLNPSTLEQFDTLGFFKNCLRWTAGQKPSAVIGVVRNQKLTAYLNQQGLQAKDINLEKLNTVDVLIISAGQISLANSKQIEAFIQQGGGIITGGLGWGWKQLNPGKDLRYDFAANQLLSRMGIVWADGYASTTSKGGYLTEPFDCHLLNASAALEKITRPSGQLKPQELKQAGATLTLAIRSLPEDDKILMPAIAKQQAQISDTAIPTNKNPLKQKDVMARLLLTHQILETQNTAPEKISAHPAADFFPGIVRPDAPRVSKKLTIDTSIPRWHSTGLYAATGEQITVTVSAEAAGAKLNVRIGCHKDQIWHHDQWKRAPEITRSFAVQRPQTIAANAFGGLIYIEVPKNCSLNNTTIQIEGAVRAPYYVHGKTSLQDWNATIRNNPAPWAELATDRIIITVPSANVRQLDDPASLMEVWNAILDACAELASIDKQRPSPERIVPDLQISAGYMHSGYPIMTHADQYAKLVDKEHLLEGNWGLFHELGHNHQQGDWTFSGTGEVTVNLFTTYVYDKVCGVRPEEGRVDLDRQKTEYEKYVAAGREFEQWKSKPFLALVMYLQLQQEFGWQAYKDVFSQYQTLEKDRRPKTDDEKRDQWMVHFSKTVERNLGPFFDAWNVPVSENAKKQTTHLPVWMPDEMAAQKQPLAIQQQ